MVAVGDIVEKFGGIARFWGRVACVYEIRPGEWRADVVAIHPEFENLVHIYDVRQLRPRAHPSTTDERTLP